MNPVVKWFRQIRGPFLILSVVLVSVGTGTAFAAGVFHPIRALLLLAGVLAAHCSVNLFNEWSDEKTGIDRHTSRTPFSGGSGLIQTGQTHPAAVKRAACLMLLTAALIGLYFAWSQSWFLLVFMAIGGFSIFFYTSHLARWQLGEAFSGIALGSLVVAGVHLSLTGDLPLPVVLISVPPGLLTALLLFLNEFPDMEADRQGGRRHLVIRHGRQKSAWIYAAGLLLTFVWIGSLPVITPYGTWVTLALIPLPLAVWNAYSVIGHAENMAVLVPAMGRNVLIVLLTDGLLAAGLWLTGPVQ